MRVRLSCLSLFIFLFSGCSSKAVTTDLSRFEAQQTWQSLGVVIRDGRQTAIYSLSNDGVLRLSCMRGVSNLILRDTELSTHDFQFISNKVAELEDTLTLNRQAVGAVVVSLVKDRPGLSVRSRAFKSINADSRVEAIVGRFRAILADCSQDQHR